MWWLGGWKLIDVSAIDEKDILSLLTGKRKNQMSIKVTENKISRNYRESLDFVHKNLFMYVITSHPSIF